MKLTFGGQTHTLEPILFRHFRPAIGMGDFSWQAIPFKIIKQDSVRNGYLLECDFKWSCCNHGCNRGCNAVMHALDRVKLAWAFFSLDYIIRFKGSQFSGTVNRASRNCDHGFMHWLIMSCPVGNEPCHRELFAPDSFGLKFLWFVCSLLRVQTGHKWKHHGHSVGYCVVVLPGCDRGRVSCHPWPMMSISHSCEHNLPT